MYKQCNLTNGDSHMTAWLDASVAKPGIRVTLKDSANPEDWWTIDAVGDTAMARKDIKGAHGSENWFKKDYLGKLKGLKVD